MMKRIIYFAVILVLGPCSLNAYALDLAPYFNLTEGRTLVYDRYDFQAGVPVFDGSFATVVVSLAPGVKGNLQLELPGVEPNNLDIWILEADGHHWLGELDIPAGILNHAEPPPGPVDGTMEVGQLVSFDFQEFENGVFQGATRVEETLLAANVPCPPTTAGTFNDCVYILLEMYFDGFLDERSIWIWANNVGPVLEYILAPDGTPIEARLLTSIIP